MGALAVVVCRLAAVAAVGGARSLADGEVVADDGVGRPAPAVRLVLVLAFAQDDVDLVGLRRQGGTAGGLTQPVGTEGRDAGADVGVDDVVHIARELVGRHLAAAVQLGHAAGCALFRCGDRADVGGLRWDCRLVLDEGVTLGVCHVPVALDVLLRVRRCVACLTVLVCGVIILFHGVGQVVVRLLVCRDGAICGHAHAAADLDAAELVLGCSRQLVALADRFPLGSVILIQQRVGAVVVDLSEFRVCRCGSERLHDRVLDLVLREVDACQKLHALPP